MKKDIVAEYQSEFEKAFTTGNYRQAHKDLQIVLEKMVADNVILFEVISRSLQDPSFLKSVRINPVIAIPMMQTADFTLVANCWIPRPDGNTEISHQSIHHHGNLILTSASAFGEGYESILFKKLPPDDFAVQNIKIDKTYKNPRGQIEFVDSYTPHIVFYPRKVSVTYALWSREAPLRSKNLAKSSVLQKFRKPIKKTLELLRLSKALGLNQEVDLDFSVRGSQLVRLGRRIKYQPGSNENFLQALHYLLKEIGFDREEDLQLLRNAQGLARFENEFEQCQLLVADVNLSKRELLDCLNS